MASQADLIRVYQSTSRGITEQVTGLLTRYWATLDGWRDANAAAFVSQVLPIVEGAAGQLASLTDAYLTHLIGQQLGQSVTPLGLRPPTIQELRGVPGTEVYNRPFVTTRAAIGDGLSLTESAGRGLERLTQLVRTDMQLSRRSTSRRVLAAHDRVVGYRRVLGSSKSCALCVIASTQRYHREQLLPIHTKCSCGVAPIVGDSDPGQVINEPLLESTHEAIRTQFGDTAVDYSGKSDLYRARDLITVYDHGEMGPTLAVAGQHHTIL